MQVEFGFQPSGFKGGKKSGFAEAEGAGFSPLVKKPKAITKGEKGREQV